MKLEAKREHLLKPLQSVIGAVERRQTLPILTNVLVNATEQALTWAGTCRPGVRCRRSAGSRCAAGPDRTGRLDCV